MQNPLKIYATMLLIAFGSSGFAYSADKNSIGSSFRDCSDCPELVAIPAGEFLMGEGDDKSKDESAQKSVNPLAQPQHRVSVSSFAIAKYDVTRGEFEAFVKESGYNSIGCKTYDERGFVFDPKASWREPGFSQSDNDPVVCISWEDAHQYLAWLNAKLKNQGSKLKSDIPIYRLPTEAEWEYAARAGTTTSTYWGNAGSEQCVFANGADLTFNERYPDHEISHTAICRDGYVSTSPVGSFRPNSWGLFDMLGNVEQWTEDCANVAMMLYPSKGWSDGNCDVHVSRGGGWTTSPQGISSSYQYADRKDLRESNHGFRVARNLQ